MEQAYREWRNIEQHLGRDEQIVDIEYRPIFIKKNDQLQVENLVIVCFLILGIKLIK